MEPVTHLLTGACLARTGLNRRAAYATVAMVIAAEFPDIDTVWSLRGPVAGFEHHRGITHTFFGIPFEAGLILLGVFAFHRLRKRKAAAKAPPPLEPEAGFAAPARWGTLYLLLLVALLSHLLLDYTNNYGLRPFFPFNPRWYAGSIVFIFDPLIFLFLVAGLSLPALFGFIGKEIGARRDRFRGRGWARAALLGVLLLWSLRWFEHNRAVALAQNQTLRAPASPEPDADLGPSLEGFQTSGTAELMPEEIRPLLMARKSLASPDPLSIFRWYTATNFGPVQRIGVADTRVGTYVPGALFSPPQPSPQLVLAEGTHLGRVYLDWSPMPIISSASGIPGDDDPAQIAEGSTTITFSDPRFMGDIPLLHAKAHPPLTGEIVLKGNKQVVLEGIDGRFGR